MKNNEEKLVVTKSMSMKQLVGADEVEMVFILTFWQQSNLDFDFPIIAHEFLKHEADSLSQYTDGPYFKNVIDQRDPRSALRNCSIIWKYSSRSKHTRHSSPALKMI